MGRDLVLCGATQAADSCRSLQYSNFLIFRKKIRGFLRDGFISSIKKWGAVRRSARFEHNISPFFAFFVRSLSQRRSMIQNDEVKVFYTLWAERKGQRPSPSAPIR